MLYLDKPEFKSVSLKKIATQQWVNLFMRPEEAWDNWKRTGFPEFKDQPVPEEGVAFLESITSGGSDLLVPRRCVLPTPNQENIDNYNAALDLLIADPNYGKAVNETEVEYGGINRSSDIPFFVSYKRVLQKEYSLIWYVGMHCYRNSSYKNKCENNHR